VTEHHLLEDPMEIRIQRDGNATIVRVTGSCDMRCHIQLRERLLELEAEDAGHIVIDLSDLTFIDSVGLKVLIGAWKRSRHGRHRFSVRLGVNGQVRRVFELTGLDRVMPLEQVGS
jgi:anti-anti-sigma factor